MPKAIADDRETDPRPLDLPEAPAPPRWQQPPPVRREQLRKGGQSFQQYPATVSRSRNQAARSTMPWPTLTRQQWRRIGRAAAMVAVVAAWGMALGWLLSDERFTISGQQVAIIGAQRVDVTAIYEASQLEGANIFRARPDRAAGRISTLTGIAEANIQLRLPNQAIIQVREWEPFVMWQGVTRTVWLAENGAEVPAVGEPPPLKLTDPTGAAADGEGRMQLSVLADLRAIYAARADLTDLYYGRQEGVYLRTPGGATAYLGRAGNMPIKLQALSRIEAEMAERKLQPQMIDLRYEGRAQVR